MKPSSTTSSTRWKQASPQRRMATCREGSGGVWSAGLGTEHGSHVPGAVVCVPVWRESEGRVTPMQRPRHSVSEAGAEQCALRPGESVLYRSSRLADRTTACSAGISPAEAAQSQPHSLDNFTDHLLLVRPGELPAAGLAEPSRPESDAARLSLPPAPRWDLFPAVGDRQQERRPWAAVPSSAEYQYRICGGKCNPFLCALVTNRGVRYHVPHVAPSARRNRPHRVAIS